MAYNTVLAFNCPDSTTFAGNVSGSGSLVQQGTGTLTLTGANTYTGTTTISQGELCVTGSITSAVTVASGAALSGTGSTGAVTANGTVSPGVGGVGTLNTGNLGFTSGSSYNVELTDDGYDQVNVTGSVNLGSASLTVTSTRANHDNDVLVLIRNDGTDSVSGTFAGLSDGDMLVAGGVTYYITYTYNAETGIGMGNDVALVDMLTVSGDDTVDEGTEYTLTLGSVDGVETYVVHWGDEQITSVAAGDLLVNHQVKHTYTDGLGSRAITVDLADDDGLHTNVANSKSITVTGTTVTFSDPDLAAAVCEALAIPAGASLSTYDLGRLTSLTADSNLIGSLTGLNYAYNLESLTLVPSDFSATPAGLSDMSPVGGLSNLKTLTLQHCGLGQYQTCDVGQQFARGNA